MHKSSRAHLRQLPRLPEARWGQARHATQNIRIISVRRARENEEAIYFQF